MMALFSRYLSTKAAVSGGVALHHRQTHTNNNNNTDAQQSQNQQHAASILAVAQLIHHGMTHITQQLAPLTLSHIRRCTLTQHTPNSICLTPSPQLTPSQHSHSTTNHPEDNTPNGCMKTLHPSKKCIWHHTPHTTLPTQHRRLKLPQTPQCTAQLSQLSKSRKRICRDHRDGVVVEVSEHKGSCELRRCRQQRNGSQQHRRHTHTIIDSL